MPQTADILKKITIAGLVGRGGASYPTAKKWAAVKAALKGKPEAYIVINSAEGEPGVKKDGYILEHHAAELIYGIYLAEQFLGAAKVKKIYFFFLVVSCFLSVLATGAAPTLIRSTLKIKAEPPGIP